MLTYTLLYVVHLLAAILWVGGMFFAWMILRPAAVAVLQPPERLQLWLQVFQRFFRWVWAAVVLLPASGVALMQLRFGGFDTAPGYVHGMLALYLIMLALFLRISLLNLPQLHKAVAAQDWPSGGAVLGRIRRLVGINLLVGLVLVSIAGARLF